MLKDLNVTVDEEGHRRDPLGIGQPPAPTLDRTGWKEELARKSGSSSLAAIDGKIVKITDGLQEQDLKTPEGRMAMAHEVLEMIDRVLNEAPIGGPTITSAGISPVIFDEAMAIAQGPQRPSRIGMLTLLKTAGMAPESAFLLRGRSIIRIVTFGRD